MPEANLAIRRHNMPDRDDLDLLLDSALATYADPGPDSGLEQRVLTSLADARTAREGRSRQTRLPRWLVWSVAVPIAASLLLWIGMEQFRHTHLTQQQQAFQSRPSPSSHGSQQQTSELRTDSGPLVHGALKGHDFSRAANATHSRRASALEGRFLTARRENRAPLPKLAVFPSPQPLTAEEQALVAAATRGSETQRTALLEAARPPSDAPLAIADLTIPPLVPPDEGK
jgi:hypothetical protein